MENKKLIIVSVFLFLLNTVVFAGGGGEDVEINIDANRQVEPAFRNPIQPSIIDTSIQASPVNYPLLNLRYATESEMNRINPATINIKEPLKKLYNTYVKLGFSTELMPFGEIYFDAKRSRKFLYGAHVKHLSSYGDIPNFATAQFDRTKGLIYGGFNERYYSIRGDVHYNNQGLHYYGISDTLGLHKDSISQRYSDFGVETSFDWHKRDSAKLNFNVGLAYNNFSSKKPFDENLRDWRAKENAFDVNSNFWYKWGQEVFALDFNVRYNGYRYGVDGDTLTSASDSSIFLNNTIVNLKPTVTTFAFDDKLRAKAGFDIVVDAHREIVPHFYPVLEAKYSLFNDIIIPYAGLRGDLKQQTFKSLTAENEFLLPNIELRNENTALDFYAGIKGTLSKRMSFNSSISFARVKDMAMFVTDSVYSIGNKFNVIYDTLSRTTIEASLAYQLTEKLKVDAMGKFHSYNLLNNEYAWNKPQVEVLLRGSYNLVNKFLVNLDFKLEEGRRALGIGPGEGITLENGQYVQKLGLIADGNLGLEYRYNERASFFLQLNNFVAQRYKRWYNTPVQSIQFLGGFTFKF